MTLTSDTEVVVFTSEGDTRILVTDDYGADKVFVVSSQAMRLACDAWNRMLAPDGYFKEAQPAADGMKEVELPDDESDALAILLDIAHLRFDRVPRTLDFQDLLDVAVLTDKYGIINVRENVIDDLFNLCHKYFEKYKASHESLTEVCKQSTDRKACDAMLYGQFQLELYRQGITELGKTSRARDWSINKLAKRLKSIRINTFPQATGMALHYECNFQDEFISSIRNILDNIPPAVLDHHKVHIERQRAILHPG